MNPLPSEFGALPPWLLFLLLVWSLVWKGLALWRAARLSQRNWFVIILVLNTAGILEIAYLFVFSKGEKNRALDLKFFKIRW